MSLPFALIGSTSLGGTLACKPNYFMGGPARDNASQKVLVGDKLATTCPVEGSSSSSAGTITGIVTLAEGGTGAALTGIPGGILYATSATQMAITDAGTAGYVLTSNGAGEPYWAMLSSPVVVGAAGTILRSNGVAWVASTATFAGTYPANAVLFSNGANAVSGDAGFTWNTTLQNLQLGTTGVSIGVGAGLGTSSVAVGDLAGAWSQGSNAVAVGKTGTGQTSQGDNSVALGNQAAQTFQGNNSIALGSISGQYFQGSNAVALGTAGSTFQGAGAIAIGAVTGQVSQGVNAVALGPQSGRSFQGASAIAIGANAGRFTQGVASIAIGPNAGTTNQLANAIAIGPLATGGTNQGFSAIAFSGSAAFFQQGDYAISLGGGALTRQGTYAVAIAGGGDNQGNSAVACSAAGGGSQGINAVAIGRFAAYSNQGAAAIAIGNIACQTNQTNNSIALNASGLDLPASQIGFFVNPVRTQAIAANSLTLAVTNNEIVINSAKTFVLEHPLTPKTHYLVHSCLEGPEAAVYYRGIGKISKGTTESIIILPRYASQLADHFTVQVSPASVIRRIKTSCVYPNETFRVSIDRQLVDEDLVFFWMVWGKRQFAVPVEVLKAQVNLKGQPPYQWLEKKENELELSA